MKNTFLLSVLFLWIVIISSCKKNNGSTDPLSQLPAATQTGDNTGGCLLNGQAYIVRTSFLSSSNYQCNYQYVKGDYFFFLSLTDDNVANAVSEIVISTDSLALVAGQTYKFKNQYLPKNAFAGYAVFTNAATNLYGTNDGVSGQLYISHLDQVKQIVSGTFYFDAINKSGETVHVTDGRFDMKYTL